MPTLTNPLRISTIRLLCLSVTFCVFLPSNPASADRYVQYRNNTLENILHVRGETVHIDCADPRPYDRHNDRNGRNERPALPPHLPEGRPELGGRNFPPVSEDTASILRRMKSLAPRYRGRSDTELTVGVDPTTRQVSVDILWDNMTYHWTFDCQGSTRSCPALQYTHQLGNWPAREEPTKDRLVLDDATAKSFKISPYLGDENASQLIDIY